MTEQEAQQAQTIKNTRELLQIARFNNIEAVSVEVADELLKIVDSQAQKIAEQAKEIEIARRAAEGFRDYHYESSGDTGIYPEHRFPWETTDSKEVAR